MFALLTRGWLFWIWSIRLKYESHYNQDCTKNGSEVLKKMSSSCFFSHLSFQTFFDFALRFIGRAAMLTHRTRWTGKIWAVIWSQRMTWTSFSIRFLKKRLKKMKLVFCFQNCSDLLWEKIVLVIEENFWNSRLKAENFQNFWDHLNNLFKQWKVRTIFGNRMLF